jgi:hypothetical protein
MSGVTLEEITVGFLLMVLGFIVGRKDAEGIADNSHNQTFWVGFEEGYKVATHESKEGVDNSTES